jgi:hypothetical protein
MCPVSKSTRYSNYLRCTTASEFEAEFHFVSSIRLALETVKISGKKK